MGWQLAGGADERTLDRLVDRAIGLFEAGDVHAARAVFYLATPDPATAARTLAALTVGPPHPQPDSQSGAGLGRLLARPVPAQTVGWEETYRDLRGRLRGLYRPVPVVWPPGVCEHGETICPQCLDSWAEDYALALFDHGLRWLGGRSGFAAGRRLVDHATSGRRRDLTGTPRR